MAYVNTGDENYKVIEGFYLDDNSVTHVIAPNIAFISQQAFVPDTATITFNVTTSPAPSGGSNDDIWYNSPTDTLYKNISGSWVPLTDRVANDYYIGPVQNLTDCPI